MTQILTERFVAQLKRGESVSPRFATHMNQPALFLKLGGKREQATLPEAVQMAGASLAVLSAAVVENLYTPNRLVAGVKQQADVQRALSLDVDLPKPMRDGLDTLVTNAFDAVARAKDEVYPNPRKRLGQMASLNDLVGSPDLQKILDLELSRQFYDLPKIGLGIMTRYPRIIHNVGEMQGPIAHALSTLPPVTVYNSLVNIDQRSQRQLGKSLPAWAAAVRLHAQPHAVVLGKRSQPVV